MHFRALTLKEQKIYHVLEQNSAPWEQEYKCGGLTFKQILDIVKYSETELGTLLANMSLTMTKNGEKCIPSVLLIKNDAPEGRIEYYRYYINKKPIPETPPKSKNNGESV